MTGSAAILTFSLPHARTEPAAGREGLSVFAIVGGVIHVSWWRSSDSRPPPQKSLYDNRLLSTSPLPGYSNLKGARQNNFRMRRHPGVDRERTAARVTSRGNFPQRGLRAPVVLHALGRQGARPGGSVPASSVRRVSPDLTNWPDTRTSPDRTSCGRSRVDACTSSSSRKRFVGALSGLVPQTAPPCGRSGI